MSGEREVLWDCDACATRGLLGAIHQYCPACGAAQVSEEARYVARPGHDDTAADHPLVGVELVCLACHASNSAQANNCGSCGCSLVGARELAAKPGAGASGVRSAAWDSGTGRASESLTRGSAWDSGVLRAPASESGARALVDAGESGVLRRAGAGAGREAGESGVRRAAAAAQSGVLRAFQREREANTARERAGAVWSEQAAAESARMRRRVIIAGLGLALVVWMVSRVRGAGSEAAVTGHAWSRTIAVEQFGEVKQLGPCDRAPARATLIATRGQQCEYRVNRWHVVREVEATGEGLSPAPSWPTVRLRMTGEGDCIMCEREGPQTERYTVQVTHGDITGACEVELETWEAIEVGARVRVERSAESIDCAALIAGSAPR